MNYAPIVLFTYNRPDETSKTIKALMKNEEAPESVIYIFSDAPKTQKDKSKVESVRKIIKALPMGGFKEVVIIEQRENQGLAKSIISGVSLVFQKYDCVIVIEDDCEASPFFLNYMNRALDKYKGNERIGSISAFSPILRKCPREDVYAVLRSCSMTWGTWKDIWDSVDFQTTEYKSLRHDYTFIKNMNCAGNDRMYRYIRQVKYGLQSWSVRFGAELAKRELLTIYPKYSYIQNIGLQTGGVHSSTNVPQELMSSNSESISNPFFPDCIVRDYRIEKEFRRIYGGKLYSRLKRDVYVYFGESIIDYVREKKK